MRLSKSKLLSFLQCPKKLYLEVHQPELAVYSSSTELAFDVGNQVGDIAKTLYGDGFELEYHIGLANALS